VASAAISIRACRAHWLRETPPAAASRSIAALVSSSIVVLTFAIPLPGPFGGFFLFGMSEYKSNFTKINFFVAILIRT
jgi:hypothetical protein